ncbi:MAG: RelA/SpoT family protein [Candidatus Gracilibacteria bacterium]|jgi:GTP pyrophosphokinase
MVTIDEIIKRASEYIPEIDSARVRSAYEYAEKAHLGMYRFSGDSWMTHILAVVAILLSFKPDENTIIAGFLHDLAASPSYDLNEVKEKFGSDVASLVEAMVKVDHLRLRTTNSDLETLRSMFLAIAEDLRVVLIRLADRLQNMETLQFVQPSKRKSIAHETLEIYVPIASRLGIYTLKTHLEDLCFQYLYPQQYEDIKNQRDEYMRRKEKVMEFIIQELKTFLVSHGVQAEVEGRLKNLFSIYHKLKAKNRTSIQELFDIFAIRIILPTRLDDKGVEMTDHLYAVLGLIHSKWVPLANRFKDYVAIPKPNGYRSLHIAVIGLAPKPLTQPTEIQIRSRKMHDQADFGFAAHWFYKEDPKFNSRDKLSLKKFLNEDSRSVLQKDWLTGLARLHRDLNPNSELLKPLKVDLFDDRIFVLTPSGEVRDLPKGSTPVDFAYAIHTDLGNCCFGAKVNNVIVPLNYHLKNGEVVEVITRNKPSPKLHWLSFVKTAHAKNKIRSYLKGLDVEKSFKDGKQILNKALENLGLPELDDNLSLLKKYDHQKLSLKDRKLLVETIGAGALPVAALIKKLFEHEPPNNGSMQRNVEIFSGIAPSTVLPKVASHMLTKNIKEQIFIAGETGLPYKLSLCCKPSFGSSIVGYVSRGGAVRIHLQKCKFLKNAYMDRVLEASWGPTLQQRKTPMRMLISAVDRVGLIRDIADVIAGFNVSILDFSLKEKMDTVIQREMVLEVSDSKQFAKIMEKLMQVRNVVKVMPAGDAV